MESKSYHHQLHLLFNNSTLQANNSSSLKAITLSTTSIYHYKQHCSPLQLHIPNQPSSCNSSPSSLSSSLPSAPQSQLELRTLFTRPELLEYRLLQDPSDLRFARALSVQVHSFTFDPPLNIFSALSLVTQLCSLWLKRSAWRFA